MFFVSCTGKFCLTWGHEGIFLFSFRTFGIWFRSMTHLELIFVYGMWSESKYIFFHKDTKLFLQYLLERQILQEQLAKIGTTPKNSFGTSVKKKKVSWLNMYGSVSTLYSVPYSICLCLGQYHCLDYCVFIMNSETRWSPPTSSFNMFYLSYFIFLSICI